MALRRTSTIRRRHDSAQSSTEVQEYQLSCRTSLIKCEAGETHSLQRQDSFEHFDDIHLPVETAPDNPEEVDEVVSFLGFTNVDPNFQPSFRRKSIKRPHRCHRARISLMDLPPEIRCQIYRLVFPEQTRYRCKPLGPYNLPAPCPPAITRVSRAIRVESFEMWCTTIRLPIRFRARSRISTPMGIQGTPDYELVCTAHEFVFPYIRKLQICFDNGSHSSLWDWDGLLCFSIDLDKKRNSYVIKHTPKVDPAWPNSRPLYKNINLRGQSRIRLLMRRFDEAMTEIMAQSGGIGHITLEHYQRLVPHSSWRFWADMSEDAE